MTTKALTIQQRKSIFSALVEAQDATPGKVGESKKKVATEFKITKEQLELIEKEGVEKEWPPLDV